MTPRHNFCKSIPWLLWTYFKILQHSVSAHFNILFKIVYQIFLFYKSLPKIDATRVCISYTKTLDQMHVKNLIKTF
jgi:hypothetical protein